LGRVPTTQAASGRLTYKTPAGGAQSWIVTRSATLVDIPRPTILFLACSYPPENVSGAARPSRFARYLKESGIDVEVISAARPGTASVEGVERVPGPQTGLAGWTGARAGAIIQRFLLPYNEQLPWVAPAVEAAARILRRRNIAAVLSTSPPLATHIAGYILKRWRGIRWVADFRDPLADNPFRNRRWVFSYDAWAERRILAFADAVVANNDALAQLWRARYPGWRDKIAVVWNGFDPEEQIAAEDLPPRPYRLISHVGTLYGGRHPAALLASLERLFESGRLDPDCIRVQLTGIIEPALLERFGNLFERLRGRGCLIYDGRQVPKEEARQRAASSDYLLLLDLNEKDAGLQVPAKLFEYVRIGRPILAFTRAGSPVEWILERSGIPHRIVATSATAEETDRRVFEFLSLPAAARAPSEWFNREFDGRAQTAAIARLLLPGEAYQNASGASPGAKPNPNDTDQESR
jgi:hypothetical protein